MATTVTSAISAQLMNLSQQNRREAEVMVNEIEANAHSRSVGMADSNTHAHVHVRQKTDRKKHLGHVSPTQILTHDHDNEVHRDLIAGNSAASAQASLMAPSKHLDVLPMHDADEPIKTRGDKRST